MTVGVVRDPGKRDENPEPVKDAPFLTFHNRFPSRSNSKAATVGHLRLPPRRARRQARNAILQLRRVREGAQLEEDHMRNRQMIVHWLMANTDAIEVRERDDKTFYVMTDAEAFRAGIGELLAEDAGKGAAG